MKRIIFLITLFYFTTAICYAQSSDDAKYEQARTMYNSKQYSKALPILNELSQRNHAKALNILGLCYQYGRGVQKDVDKSYSYYKKSAELGFCSAQRNLAWLHTDDSYIELHPEEPNYKEVERLLRLAATQEADYMYELARFYLDMGVMDEWQDKDPYIYLNRAVEAGSAIAMACSGEHNIYEKQYDKASVLLHSAKDKGITTFSSFVYEIEEKTNIEICLMILHYLKKNPDLKLESYNRYNENQYLLRVSNGKGNKGLVLMSKTGAVLANTPYFHDIWISEFTNEHNPYPYIHFSTSPDNYTQYVYFINKSISLDIMDGIYKFIQQDKGYMVQNANYNGGESIYIAVSNDKEQYSYMKINKAGKILRSTPFAKDDIRVLCDEEKVNLSYGENIYLIGSKTNLETVFTILEFFSNSEYRTDNWDALFVDNSFLLVHVQYLSDPFRHKWFKLSSFGTILGKTTTESDDEIKYDSNKKIFYYYDHKTYNTTEFSLQEMLKRIK